MILQFQNDDVMLIKVIGFTLFGITFKSKISV